MGDRVERVKGAAKESKGKAKKKLGSETGRPGTQVRGAGEELKGKAQKKLGQASSAVKKATR